MNKISPKLVLVPILLAIVGLSHAQEQNPSVNPLVAKCVDSANKVILEMKSDLAKHRHLPPLKDLILFVPKADYSANALFEFKRIEISYPFCYELLFRADAMAWVNEAFPKLNTQLTAYDKEITKRTLLAEEKSKPGEPVFPTIPRFLPWVGVGNVPVPTWVGSNVEKRADEYIRDQLLTLIGHEVSHLISKDKAALSIPRACARLQEARADKNGFELANKHFSYKATPIALFPTFGLLNRSHSIVPGDLDTHPIVECRAAYVLNRVNDIHKFDDINYSPEDKAYLDKIIEKAESIAGGKVGSFSNLIAKVLAQPECELYQTTSTELIESRLLAEDCP
jgi:hypothetical protein